ncbi:MAG: hypothetical protein SFX19_07000 [Alphaproteobacteria bacterium]|nr:hypothetical protein [Alphaproteobacteria bacterium]
MINASAAISTPTTQATQNKQPATEKGDFSSALASSNILFELSSSLLDSILKSRKNDNSADASSLSPLFPFSSDFEATFGTSGPLPAFINEVSARLHLTAEQNQALQNIAIRNKDITKTPENVQKLSAELKAAGIGV